MTPLAQTFSSVDCTKFGEDRYSEACSARADTAIGVMFVIIVVALALIAVTWWWTSRRYRRRADERRAQGLLD